MKVKNPRGVYVVETMPADDLRANFKPYTTELYLERAVRIAEELGKDNDNLMIRILEKKVPWRNF